MASKTLSELDVWSGVIQPDRCDMPEPSAKAVLEWSFNDDAKCRMEELADRNGEGTITDAERQELEAFVNVGQVIAILQAKARLSLQQSEGSMNGAS